MNFTINSKLFLPALSKFYNLSVKNKYDELIDTQWLSVTDIEQYQLKKIKNLIEFVCKHNSYYRDVFIKHGINPLAIQSFEDFKKIPLLTKENLSVNFLNKMIISNIENRIVQKRCTSGTTGVPVCVLADATAYSSSLAARLRSEGWYGINFGERQARFWGRASSGINLKKEKLKDFLINRIRLSSSDLSEDHLSGFFKSLTRNKPTHFYGYASMIVDFASFLKANNLDPKKLNLKAIISTAEQIFEFQKIELKRQFGCPVVEEYGCSEVEIMAYSCPHNNMHIISENIYLEIIKEHSNDQVGKVIVTDLNNYLQPVIRYEIGDVGRIVKDDCQCGRQHPIFISEVTRNQEQYVFSLDGMKIHSVIFPHFIEELAIKKILVNKFKVVQYDDYSIDFLINFHNRKISDQKLFQDLLRTYFKKNNLKNIDCKVRIVKNSNEIKNEGKYSYLTTYIKE